MKYGCPILWPTTGRNRLKSNIAKLDKKRIKIAF